MNGPNIFAMEAIYETESDRFCAGINKSSKCVGGILHKKDKVNS